MENSEQYIDLLDHVGQIIQVIDAATFKVLYLNDAARAMYGEKAAVGSRCFDYMSGFDEQCPFCPFRKMDDDQKSLETEVENSGRFLHVRIKRTKWDGKEAFVVYGHDVNDIFTNSEESERLIGALGNAYFSTYYINLEENTIKEFKTTEKIHKLMVDGGDADAALMTMVDAIVSEKSLQTMREFVDLTTISQRLKNNSHIIHDFLYRDNGWCRAIFIKVLEDRNGDASSVFFALQHIDELIQREHTQKLQDEIIATLSRDYFAIYYINLDKQTFVVLRSEYESNPVWSTVGTSKSYMEELEEFCIEHVCEEDRAYFMQMTDIKYIRMRLEEEEAFVFRYRVDVSGETKYFEVRIVRSETDRDSKYAVMGIRSVDEQVKKELEYQEGLANAYKQVRHSLSQEEQYRNAIVSEAILIYNVNITQNLLEDNVYVMLGDKTMSAVTLAGMEAPCRAEDFYHQFAQRRVLEEYREAFIQGTDIENLKAAFERGENEQVIEFSAYFLDDKPTTVRQTMLLFQDLDTNEIIGLCNCKDITEAKRKEHEMQQALKEAYESALLANQAKSDFLSRMSHDIRTPMNAIIGMTAIAGTHIDDKERVKDSLAKISASSRHLLGIINDILDMSKIESGKINLNEEDFNLSELLSNLLDMIRPQVKERRHELKVHIHDIKHEDVVGDSLRIQQAFVNIMSNAIKYTPEGGTIVVSVSEKPTKKTKIACYEFIFEDNGIGMTQEFVDKIFDPFERAEDLRTSKIEGTGLGMSITKNIVNMMGGQIYVDSKVGEGSKFVVTIFLKLQDTVEIDTAALTGIPVLVADDDIISCENTSIMLQDIGMDSEWVLSGKEAVQKVDEHHRDGDDYFAVIVDWKMPDMNGIETTKAIRKIVGDDVPIIIISAYDWSDIEQEARTAGANAFISKPAFKSNLTKLFLGLIRKGEKEKDAEIVPEMETYDFSNKRILLVEDNDLNREIAYEILKDTGMQIEQAEDGKQAVDMFEAAPEKYYNLILMDIQMPVMNGYDATVAIRALGKRDSQSVPIIAMTANAFAEDVHAAISAGMNEHIAKPLDLRNLMACIKKWI